MTTRVLPHSDRYSHQVARTNRLPWKRVVSMYPVEVSFDPDERASVIWMLVLECSHRRKGIPGQTRARCKRCPRGGAR